MRGTGQAHHERAPGGVVVLASPTVKRTVPQRPEKPSSCRAWLGRWRSLGVRNEDGFGDGEAVPGAAAALWNAHGRDAHNGRLAVAGTRHRYRGVGLRPAGLGFVGHAHECTAWALSVSKTYPATPLPGGYRCSVELPTLRYFVAVAEELHFGWAATRLHMPQPPGRASKQSEAHVGALLFARSPAYVTLTPVGTTPPAPSGSDTAPPSPTRDCAPPPAPPPRTVTVRPAAQR